MWQATHASLLGVFAAQSLLMAFVLKLKAAASLRQQEGRLAREGHDEALYGARGLKLLGGSGAADLFCGIMPSQVGGGAASGSRRAPPVRLH